MQADCRGRPPGRCRTRRRVRPHPRACVSTPITWQEVDDGVRIEDFRIDNVRARFKKTGDLFKPLLQTPRRFDLGGYL